MRFPPVGCASITSDETGAGRSPMDGVRFERGRFMPSSEDAMTGVSSTGATIHEQRRRKMAVETGKQISIEYTLSI